MRSRACSSCGNMRWSRSIAFTSAIDRVHQPGALFFNGRGVGWICRGIEAFDGDTVLLDTLVGFDFHGLQQLGEESQLLGVHVVVRRHGQQLFLCH